MDSLQWIYYNHGSTFFSLYIQNRQEVNMLHEDLADLSIAKFSGDLDFKERRNILGQFLAGKCRILATTDVLSRGINGTKIAAVINFTLPCGLISRLDPTKANTNLKIYKARIGRCDRLDLNGISISFGDDHEQITSMARLLGSHGHNVTIL